MRETSRHLTAFAVYVQLGPRRSHQRLHAELTRRRRELGFDRVPSVRTLERWSSELHWQERLDAIEREAAEKVDRALADEQVEALARRRKLGLSLQQQGLEVLRDRSFADWSVRDALRSVERGSAMEIESIGAGPGDRSSDELLRRVTRRLEGFTDEELKRLARDASDSGPDRSGAA